jgi:hypothetical protein
VCQHRGVRVPLTAGLVAVVLLAVAACGGSPSPSPAPAPAPGPGADGLDGWKLTLPEGNQKGGVKMVDPAALTPPWLTADADGDLVFFAPVEGATTAHSEHARTELDALDNFTAGQGTHALTATLTVTQVPTSRPTVIVGQIHGAADISSVPFVMVYYDGGRVRVVVKQQQTGSTSEDHVLLTDVALGTPFTYGITDNGDGTIGLTAAVVGDPTRTGTATAAIPAAFTGATVRFQAGAYQQADTAAADAGTPAPAAAPSAPDGDGARVVFSQLDTR